MIEPIELVLSDVDGTLVTSPPRKLVTPASVAAAAELTAAGVRLAIASARPPRGLVAVARQLGLTAPLAGFNGAAFVTPSLETLAVHPLPPAALDEASEVFQAHGVDLWIFAGSAWLLANPRGPYVGEEQATVGFAPDVSADPVQATRALGEPVLKLVGVSPEPERLARCQEELGHRLGEAVSATCSQPYYLDVTHRDANKGRVLEFFADHFGIPLARIATVGDGHNDVQMFRRAGLSVAMGNAAPEVQRAAMHVTASNDDDGFAKAVRTYVLTRPRR